MAPCQAIEAILEEGLWNCPYAYYVVDDTMYILSFTIQPYIILSIIYLLYKNSRRTYIAHSGLMEIKFYLFYKSSKGRKRIYVLTPLKEHKED